MKKMILAVALSLCSTAVFAQLTMTPMINSNNSSSKSSSQQTTATPNNSDILTSDSVAGLGTSDTVAGLSSTDSQTVIPAFGHTGTLRQPGSIRH